MQIEGLGKIAGQFGGMLVDQFGVLHNGQRVYPGAIQVLDELAARHIPVVVMTNSGKRSAANRQRLLDMGLKPHHFAAVLSSGELAIKELPGKRVFVIGRRGEDYCLGDVVIVDDPHAADLLLILGSDAPRTSLADYRNFFSGLSVPAICCNPDLQMLTPQGLQPAPGAIARVYEEMGGQVTWIGKPYPSIYRESAALIGTPARILCIGDSAEHDVAGGRAAGFETLLVMTGVSEGLEPHQVSPQPDYWCQSFRW